MALCGGVSAGVRLLWPFVVALVLAFVFCGPLWWRTTSGGVGILTPPDVGREGVPYGTRTLRYSYLKVLL